MDINKILKDIILDAVNSVKKDGKDIDYLRMAWCAEDGYHFVMVYGTKDDEAVLDVYEDLDNE